MLFNKDQIALFTSELLDNKERIALFKRATRAKEEISNPDILVLFAVITECRAAPFNHKSCPLQHLSQIHFT